MFVIPISISSVTSENCTVNNPSPLFVLIFLPVIRHQRQKNEIFKNKNNINRFYCGRDGALIKQSVTMQYNIFKIIVQLIMHCI
jgi:hypothetical protein